MGVGLCVGGWGVEGGGALVQPGALLMADMCGFSFLCNTVAHFRICQIL